MSQVSHERETIFTLKLFIFRIVIIRKDYFTCDRVETWTTTADKYARFLSLKPCRDSLPLYPRCISLHRL